MAIRERVSLFKRYPDDRLLSRDVFKTYYLIMEGTNTEPIYFKHLERKLSELKVHNNIKLIYLDRTLRDRGSNTPEQLLNFLLDYRKLIEDENAVFWVVFDRDSYKSHPDGKSEYLRFIENAKNKDVNLLVTSPCFEIWILLHRQNAYKQLIAPNEAELFVNRRISPGYTYISRLVKNRFGFNPKTNIPASLLNNLKDALVEAKYLTKSLEKMATDIGENISSFVNLLLVDPTEN
ncbi:MAG: RloB family protein [Bacilli bacterium]|nr:RloB family protein [Bacilli bacterium]